jgi:O-antigen ligase
VEGDLKRPAWLQGFLFGQLLLWVVGSLTLEALASAGLIGSVGAVLAWTFARKPDERFWEDARRWWPLGAFVAWGLVASSVAGRPPSGTGLARLLDWVAIPVAGVAWTWLTPEQRRRVALVGAWVFLVSCAVAGLQHFGIWPSLSAFESWSWTRIPFRRVYEPIPGTNRFMAGGLLFHRLKFAHSGGLVVLLAATVAMGAKGRDRVLALAVVGVGLFSLGVFPHARAGLIALLLALIFLAVISAPRLPATERRTLRLGLAAALVGTAVLVLASPSLRGRFLSATTSSGSGDRDKLLASGIRAVSQFPITGVGAGHFRPSRFPSEDMPESVREHPGKTHNQYLSTAAEMGIPGLLLFVLLLATLVRFMGAATLSACAGQSCLAFFALLSLAHDPLFHAPFSMALMLVLGVGLSQRERTPARPRAVLRLG